MQLRKQVLVGGVESLKRVVGLLRLADQVEFGVGVVNRGMAYGSGMKLPVAVRPELCQTILQGFAQGRRFVGQIQPRRAAMAMAPALLAALVLVITLRI